MQYLYGRQTALILEGGVGRRELEPAADPQPQRPLARTAMGDPFEDPARSLRLTLASDCRWLDGRTLAALLRLGHFPGVDVDLAEGVPSLGYARVPVARARPASSALGIDAYDVTTSRDPGLRAAGWVPGGGRETLPAMLPASEAESIRLCRDIAIHAGLGTDYLVSTITPRVRAARGRWLDQYGFCTPEEALGMAEAKARMYESVPIRVSPPSNSMATNVGRWRDQAAMWAAWSVRRSLASALDPSASVGERAAAPHLHAIRSLLVDALVARDAVFRLTRREAAIRTTRSASGKPSPGTRGNDLVQLLWYHTVNLLDHVFAITDNLAWVAVKRTETSGVRKNEVGFAAVVGIHKKRWAKAGELGAFTVQLDRIPEVDLVLALRALRNATVHQDGVPHGVVMLDPPRSSRVRHVMGVWLLGEQWGPKVFDPMAARSEYVDGDLAVLTFLRVADEAWSAVTRMLNDALRLLPWGDPAWLRGDPAVAEAEPWQSPWHDGSQRALFRLDKR